MDEYIFVSVLVIVIGTLFAKYKKIECDSLRSIIEEFVANQSDKEIIEEEDVVELEEIRDMIFDFVVINSKKFSNIKYNEPPGQSGTEKVS